MFAGSYFAKSYFDGGYFAPSIEIVEDGNGGKDVYLRLQQDDEEVMILIASFLPMLDRQA